MNLLKQQPIIVTSVNNSYAIALATMLKSLEANLIQGISVKVYILYKEISETFVQELSDNLKKNELVLKWIKVQGNPFSDLKVDKHISVETYYRLLLENLFPQYSKIIYLDADIIINTSIDKLWSIELFDSFLLAAPMASKESGYANGKRGLPAYKKLGIPGSTRVFNAGVMVINLNAWRKFKVSEKVVSYLKEYSEFVLWWDQDGLNCILFDKWKHLPSSWNVMTSHMQLFTTWQDSLLTEEEFKNICEDPKIIHFAGPDKPWHYNYTGPYKGYFLKYQNSIFKPICK